MSLQKVVPAGGIVLHVVSPQSHSVPSKRRWHALLTSGPAPIGEFDAGYVAKLRVMGNIKLVAYPGCPSTKT